MLVENVDALKAWLIKTLEPICDADPDPLAKYVVALLKKEKTEKELKAICHDQLDVFLQSKTKAFVEDFFEALSSKSYLPPKSTVKSPTIPDSTTSSAVKAEKERKDSESKKEPPADKPKDLREKLADKDRDKDGKEKAPPPEKIEPKDLREKLGDRDRDMRRRSLSPRRRDLDRRRSDRSRGSYYRRRSRSRSPRRYSRSPRRSRSPYRRRYRSRSPRPRSWSRSRSRSWTPRSWSRSRSRSRSKGRKAPQPDSRGSTPTLDNGKYTIPSVSGVYANVQEDTRYLIDTNRPQSRPRCKDYDEKGFCMRGDLCPYDHGTDPVIVEDVGIPSNVMSYPPGSSASGPGPGLPPAPGAGFIGHRPRMPGPPPGPPPGPMSRLGPGPPIRPDRFEGYNPEAPAISRPPMPFWGGHGAPPGPPPRLPQAPGFPPPIHQAPPPRLPSQRDHLVNIPTLPDSNKDDESPIAPPGTESGEAAQGERTVIAPKRPYSAMSSSNNQQPPHKKSFDYNRVGGYRKPTEAEMANTTLQVIKIPKDCCNIAKINEHFGKFGNLVNIKIDGDTALVSYSTNAEALAAFRSPEPVFNNRFIKLFWHKPDKQNQQPGDGTDVADTRNVQTVSVKSRLGTIPPMNKLSLNNTIPKSEAAPAQDHSQQEKTMVFASSGGNITKTLYNPDAIKAKVTSPTAVQTASFVLKIEAIKRQEQIKKEAMQKKVEIQKQKQQLLTKQLEQQKTLIEKLEKSKTMSSDDKETVMQTLKMLETSINKLKTELLPKKLSVEVNVKTPEQARKEILDTELELMTKSHSGNDTTQLKLKLNELTRQANVLGLLGRGRGRGASRGRGSTTWVAGGAAAPGRGTMRWNRGGGGGGGRGFNPGSRTLDKRPKLLEVTGFDQEDKDEILGHFMQYGQVDKIDFEPDGLTAIVNFKTRREAEQAVIFGSKYKEKILAVKWHIPIKRTISSDNSFPGSHVAEDEVAVTEDDIDEDALLAGDDDDEEDEESRSWRR